MVVMFTNKENLVVDGFRPLSLLLPKIPFTMAHNTTIVPVFHNKPEKKGLKFTC